MTYADVPANISIRLACVTNARESENSAVKVTIIPSLTRKLDTKYKMTIELTGSKDDSTSPTTWMTPAKQESQ